MDRPRPVCLNLPRIRKGNKRIVLFGWSGSTSFPFFFFFLCLGQGREDRNADSGSLRRRFLSFSTLSHSRSLRYRVIVVRKTALRSIYQVAERIFRLENLDGTCVVYIVFFAE